MQQFFWVLICVSLGMFSCAKDSLFLSGHIKRAHDAVLTTCDPYSQGVVHNCIVFSSAFKGSLFVFDASAGEMVLAPNSFPLKVKVGPATDLLVPVVSADKKFDRLLALDRSLAAYYPVRLFPSEKKRSFSSSISAVKLKKSPLHMAAAEIDGTIIAASSFFGEARLELNFIHKASFNLDGAPITIDFAPSARPNKVVFDNKNRLWISDAANPTIYTLDLSNAAALKSGVKPAPEAVDIGMLSDQIFIRERDLQEGLQHYAVVFEAAGLRIKLINLDKKKVEAETALEMAALAGYFPDEKSAPCCKNNSKTWFSVVTLDGNLKYITINKTSDGFKLEKDPQIDLKSESNLALSSVNFIKILGGAIEPDPGVERPDICKNNRQTFYIASFGSSKSYLYSEPQEVEAHAYSCEGEASASLFGVKPTVTPRSARNEGQN